MMPCALSVGLRRRPIPFGDDEIAFFALRARRIGLGQFALGNAVGPIAERRQSALGVEAADGVDHVSARLSGLDAPFPRRRAAIEMAELLGNRPCRLVAELMAGNAAV